MRIWIGNEMEGANRGVKTMFVETSYVGKRAISIILKYIQPDIKVIYLGAGRIDTKFIHKHINSLRSLGKLVTVETSANNLKNINLDVVDNCIVRIDAEHIPNSDCHKLHLKLDNYKSVFVYDSVITAHITNLTTLQNGQFTQTDKEIYNNKKGEN
jgi:hypothetical protein